MPGNHFKTEEERRSAASGKGRRAAAAIAAAAVVLAAVFVGKPAYDNYRHAKAVSSSIDTDAFYSGTVVAGVDLGGKTMAQAKQAVGRALAKTSYDIRITYESKSWEITGKDLSFSYNTDEVLKEAYSYARTGDREERYKLVTALKSNAKKYSVTPVLDEDALKSKLKSITDSVSYSAQEPSVTGFDQSACSFSVQDGKDGVSADGDKLFYDVKNIINGAKTGTAELSAKTVSPKLTLQQLKSRLGKLGSYSTVSKNSAAGTHNMSLALSEVNGTCVKAGGTFSFLGVVGSCDQAHGYEKAGAILNGKSVQQYGGGICQASTTLYGAALRSGMEITVRSNHTIPSGYCPIGQDATVSYPGLDLKFKNITAYPAYIVTNTTGKTLTATFYGYLPPEYDTITVSSQVTQTIQAPSTVKYTEDASLAKGTVKLVSKARTGYRAKASRTYYKNGKAVKTENLPSSYYKAQQAIYSYGKGTTLDGNGKPVSSEEEKASSAPSSQAQQDPSSGNQTSENAAA